MRGGVGLLPTHCKFIQGNYYNIGGGSMKRTKIVCTIGPASESREVLKDLLKNGMNVARLNFSHGNYSEHKNKITLLREVSKELEIPVAILLDTKGPEIRIKEFSTGKALLEEGQRFIITTRDIKGNEDQVAVKMCIRDRGRALNIPYGKVDFIAKQVPMEIGMTIEKALEVNSELAKIHQEEEEVNSLIEIAKSVEGLPRHASTHAAGVVISNRPVVEHVPLYMHNDCITTQYPMGILEELGLLKMDFLGLRTLTVIRDTIENIKLSKNIDIDIDNITFDDKKTFNLISDGDTLGIFQLESSGMQQFMKELKPDSFEDIVAGVALYRPGPMEQIPTYVTNKKNPTKIQYLHKVLEPILNVTYGCIIYQEQVMQIVRDVAGYSMARSDLSLIHIYAQLKKNNIYSIVVSSALGAEDILLQTGIIKQNPESNVKEINYEIPKKLIEEEKCKRAYLRGAFLSLIHI